ncbi:MAG: hypothetical protein ACRDTF_17440 [Pseudonocardiaceae bacterium]
MSTLVRNSDRYRVIRLSSASSAVAATSLAKCSALLVLPAHIAAQRTSPEPNGQ